MNAAHRGTMFLQGDQPWSTRPVFLDIPHDPSKPAAFFYFDLWHCFHLGMGKSFVASVFALISDRLPGGAVDARFAHLTDLYLQFCDEERTAPYITAITTALVGWPDRKTYPNGQWHKGHTTTAFCHFLERWFAVNNIAGDLLLRKSHEATVCINRCLHMLYASDLWAETCQVSSHRTAGHALPLLVPGACQNQLRSEHIFLWVHAKKPHTAPPICRPCSGSDNFYELFGRGCPGG